MCGRRRLRTSFSNTFDNVLRLVSIVTNLTNLKLDMSDLSSPGFLISSVTRPSFKSAGKYTLLNDRLASLVMSGTVMSAADFNRNDGKQSVVDVLEGRAHSILSYLFVTGNDFFAADTFSHAVTLTFDPITLNFYSTSGVMCLNSVQNASESNNPWLNY